MQAITHGSLSIRTTTRISGVQRQAAARQLAALSRPCSRTASVIKFKCKAAGESYEAAQEDAVIEKVPMSFLDALKENTPKKDQRNWEAEEIAAAMDPLDGGMAPELVQGRLAMLGWLGVIFAEKASGLTAWEQYGEHAFLINSVAVLMFVGTLFPVFVTGNTFKDILQASKTGLPKAVQDFNGNVEEQVGRAAMVGFGILLVVEATGTPFFL